MSHFMKFSYAFPICGEPPKSFPFFFCYRKVFLCPYNQQTCMQLFHEPQPIRFRPDFTSVAVFSQMSTFSSYSKIRKNHCGKLDSVRDCSLKSYLRYDKCVPVFLHFPFRRNPMHQALHRNPNLTFSRFCRDTSQLYMDNFNHSTLQ